MKTRRLGRTGLEVSELCLGTMTFGNQCDERASFAILDRAADSGVDFLDTADCYPVPPTAETAVDTSMQTDAYDPEALSLYLSAERDRVNAEKSGHDDTDSFAPGAFDLSGLREPEESGATTPIDLDGWTERRDTDRVDADDRGVHAGGSLDDEGSLAGIDSRGADTDDEEDAVRASRAALRRWAVGGDGSRAGTGD